MKRPSTTEKSFLDAVQSLFAASEVMVVVRYVYGAGSRDFLILKEMSQFHDLLVTLRERDSIVVMKSFQKIKEGRVDQTFIDGAAAVYRSGNRWILVGRDNFEHTADWAYAGSEGELREELQDRIGNDVCIVDEPNYISEEHSIGAYILDKDGVVRPGAY